MEERQSSGESAYILPLSIFLLLAALTAAYWWVTGPISPVEPPGSPRSLLSGALLVAFWLMFIYLVFFQLLRGISASFVRTLKQKLWARILFPAYLSVHLIIYGYVLEKIVVLTSGLSTLSLQPQAYFMGIYYYRPHTLLGTVVNITENPGVFIILPPFYAVVLGPFALFSAFLIGVLVVVHTDRLMRVSGRLRKAGGSIIYPTVGIVGGASCCISLPDLAVYGTPFGVSAFSIHLWTSLLYSLYYFLPLTVIAAFLLTLMPVRGSYRQS